jgi:2-polyprenyl-3-methyl-5-hydroxy-6-metoxy-1,4-benzoquinol methylase
LSLKAQSYKRNFRNCPICHSHKHTQFTTFAENGKLYVVSLCEKCGFVFQNLIFNKEHYHSLPCSYPKDYFKHSYNRANYIYDFIKEYIKRDLKVDILDIGAGKCEPLKYLRLRFRGHHAYKDESSMRGTAITLEPKEEIYMADKIYMDSEFFDFEDDEKVNEFISRNEKKFDFIIMSHVLEHFIDPDKAIKNVIKLLAPDGIVYIEVPDLYYTEYRTKSVWTPEHLSYFTSMSLTNLMQQNKFRFWKFNTDHEIWGNIKMVWKYNENYPTWSIMSDKNVVRYYNKNKFKKWVQRMKHKLGFKYEANV